MKLRINEHLGLGPPEPPKPFFCDEEVAEMRGLFEPLDLELKADALTDIFAILTAYRNLQAARSPFSREEASPSR